jgi:hypothetical protein
VRAVFVVRGASLGNGRRVRAVRFGGERAVLRVGVVSFGGSASVRVVSLGNVARRYAYARGALGHRRPK